MAEIATIMELFEEQVQLAPNRVAISYKNQLITYQDLNARANQLSHYLRDLGVKPDDIVAICLNRSADLLIAMLAVLKAGGGYLPLDQSHPAERLQLVLEDSKPSILITRSHAVDTFNFFPGKIITIDRENSHLTNQPTTNPERLTDSSNLAYLIYTSGTTGTPKGVLIEQKGVVNYTQWINEVCHLHPNDRVDFSANPIFDLAVTVCLMPVLLGMRVVICDDDVKKDIREYINFLSKSRISFIKATPSFFRVMLNELEETKTPLPDLRVVLMGGERLYKSDCERWYQLYPNKIVYNEYGPTEVTVAATIFKVNKDELAYLGSEIPIGKAGTNLKTRLTDSGELLLGGVGVARGYLNRPDLNNEKFLTDDEGKWYKTGDICQLLVGGNILFLGRNDDQIKIRGYRIEPAEVEAGILSHPDVKEVTVVAREIAREKQLVAYYILKNKDQQLDSKTLRAFLAKHLVEYMIPSVFVQMTKFPLNANNKLDKYALPNPIVRHANDSVGPKTAVEEKLLQIWCNEFQLPDIGLDDNFFELGGHSLIATRILSKVQRFLGKRIYLQDIYITATPRELVKLIEKSEKQVEIVNDQEIWMRESIPLSDSQFMFWMSNLYEAKAKELNVIARKRFKGNLDKIALNYAFKHLMQKQEILSYQFFKYKPLQKARYALPFIYAEKELSNKSKQEIETVLSDSIKELIKFYPWDPNKPALIARLFKLSDECELQIAMPHIVSDDISAEIIFKDLSAFYNSYQKDEEELPKSAQYHEYVWHEKKRMNRHLERDIAYWEKNLADTTLFPFPQNVIVKNMAEAGFSYSTYVPFPTGLLEDLRQTCATHHITLTNLLCAVLGKVLENYYDKKKYGERSIICNIVKTTRDNEIFDDTVGSFLKLDVSKLKMGGDVDVIEKAKQLQQAMIIDTPYQNCSGLVKLACLSRGHIKSYAIVNWLANLFAHAYTRLFPSFKLDPTILKMYGRLFFFGRVEHFLVNFNLWGNFITPLPKHYFGLEQTPLPLDHFDLINLNNVLDVCFLRDDADKPYVAISGNLQPAFREHLARELLSILDQVRSSKKS